MQRIWWIALLVACSTPPVDTRPHLQAVCDAIGVPIVSGIELPSLPGEAAEVPQRGVYLDVYPNRFVMNGHVFATLGETTVPLQAARMAAMKREVDPVLIVSAAGSTSAKRVHEAVEAAHTAGYSRAAFLAFSAETISLPAPLDTTYDADLQARIGSLPVQERGQHVAAELGEALTGCVPAQKAMGRIAVAPSGRKCAVLADTLGPALLECPQHDAARVATLARFMATPAYPTRATAILRDLSVQAQHLEAPATWQESVSTMASTEATSVWLTP